MRYPGVTLVAGETPPPALLPFVAGQLGVAPTLWKEYGQRDQTTGAHRCRSATRAIKHRHFRAGAKVTFFDTPFQQI
ncbi:DUF4158 domain-containing protein [Paraburkholderia sp. RAU2J]|uniref:DUF4158 domain-containing protein n=1 Tax=Paraburkholderia sp. RAU2J TaxID=1938810 RepID=UPI000EB210D4|nr:DUF4158 domain-containing protein [Paraburkholderia sp. RAU2J]